MGSMKEQALPRIHTEPHYVPSPIVRSSVSSGNTLLARHTKFTFLDLP
jgi:hypothetical protein